MGLLQECLLVEDHIGEPIRSWLMAGQSGYVRGVQDPQMVLASMSQIASDCGLCFLALLGDFHRAFPSVWRDDMLLLLKHGPGIIKSPFHLLARMLY